MRIDELKAIIEADIKLTQEYDGFLTSNLNDVLTVVGQHHMEHLHFFNLGYEMALKHILSMTEAVSDLDPIEKSLAHLHRQE